MGIRQLFSIIRKPRFSFLRTGMEYDGWIVLEFRIKQMLIGAVKIVYSFLITSPI